MTAESSRQRGAEHKARRAPRQRKRKPRPPRAGRGLSLSRPDLFEAAAAIAAGIQQGKARHAARDGWLDDVKTDPRLKRQTAAKLAAQVFAQNLVWRTRDGKKGVGFTRMSNREVAKAMGVSQPTAMHGIFQLHDKGHIARKVDKRAGTNEADKALTALVGLDKYVGKELTNVGKGTNLTLVRSLPQVGKGTNQKSQSPVKTPDKTPDESPGAQARATGSDFSMDGDTGQTVPAASAPLQSHATASAESTQGSAMGRLPERYPLTNRPEIAEAIRAQGFEPQAIWERFLAKNAKRVAQGKGDFVIKDDPGQYLVSIAKDEAAKRRRKEIIPGALEMFRASRGGSTWKPNGGRRRPT